MDSKKRILVVEDDLVIRENTQIFLQKSGYEVTTASNGMLGMQKAIAVIPDLIISDIIMPELNGYDFFKALQQLPETAVIPFIFVSSKSEVQDIRSGMKLGADDYLTKPFDFRELINVIEVRIKKNEKIVKSSESRFSALFNNKITGVFIYKDDNIIFANSKFQEISGYSEEELQSMSFSELIIDDNKEKVLEKINIANDGLKSDIEITFHINNKNGEKTKVKLYAGISKKHWKTILSAVVIKLDDFADDQIIDKADIQELGKLSDDYNNNLQITSKFHIKNSSEHLTKRELEVLKLTCDGLTNQEIADKLFISTRTVEFHRSNILGKTNTKNSTELVRYAIKNKLIEI